MKWRVFIRPQVEQDMAAAAAWYEERQPGLGLEFVEEVIAVWDALESNPLLNSRRHPTRNIRWKYPKRFPYRIIFEVDEAVQTVIVLAVLHAARHDSRWQNRH
mgnify:CR=1 FL=1